MDGREEQFKRGVTDYGSDRNMNEICPSFYQDDLFRELSKQVDLGVAYDRVTTERHAATIWVESERWVNILGSPVKSQGRPLSASHVRRQIGSTLSTESRLKKPLRRLQLRLAVTGRPLAIYSECPDSLIPWSHEV